MMSHEPRFGDHQAVRTVFNVHPDRLMARGNVRGSIRRPPTALWSAFLAGLVAACATVPNSKPTVSATVQAWVDAEERACVAPRCRFGRATITSDSEQAGCQSAKQLALNELARAIKVRVQSVFEDTVAETNGTAFSEVRSALVVSTDVKLEGALARCIFEGGVASAFAKMDFGPKIENLKARMETSTTRIAEHLQNAAANSFDEAFVGYARALVEAVNADDARTWLVGLDPVSATPYAHVPSQAEAAVDGLYARARSLELVPVAGNFIWAEPGARVDVRLQSAGPGNGSGDDAARSPVTIWTGPLVEGLGRGAHYTPAAQRDGRIGLPLGRAQGGQDGTTEAQVMLDWPKTLAAVRSRVVAPRAAQILDWLIDGLPPVATEVTVYTPGHPSPLVDGLRELFCDGKQSPLQRRLALYDVRRRPLSATFGREFEDRVHRALAEVHCRDVRLDVDKAPRLEVRVKTPATTQDESELRFLDRARNRRVTSSTRDTADVCALRCMFKQWEAAERTCSRLPEPQGSAALCLLRSRYYRQEYELGLSLAQKLYETDRTDPGYVAWYGILQVANGQAGAALPILEQLAAEPMAAGTPSYWLSLAVARIQADERAGACVALRRYLDIPDVPRRADAKKTMRQLGCSSPERRP